MALRDDYKPQGAIGSESVETLATKSFIGDIVPHRKRVPILDFPSLVEGAGNLSGMGTGAPELTEISTFGIAGLLMEAGDMHSLKWRVPDSCDLSQDIAFEIEWMSTNATAAAGGSVSWIMTYEPIIIGATAYSAIDTALDTPITLLDPNAAQYVPKLTSEGIISGGTISTEATDLLLRVESDAIDTATACLTRVWASYYRKFAD
jgi:hypothetical protein